MSKTYVAYPPISPVTEAPVGAQYVVLVADATLTAERVLTAGRWMKQTDAGAGAAVTYDYEPHRDYAIEVDEFNFGNVTSGSVGDMGWTLTGGNAAVTQTGVADHPGIIRISTNTTSGNVTRLVLPTTAVLPADIISVQAILRPVIVTTALVRFGLITTPGSAGEASDGIYFSFDSALSTGKWRTITRAGTATPNASDITVTANNWYYLEARKNGSNWEFYINNALQFTHSTNIPTAALHFCFEAETSDAVARTLDCDWFLAITKKLGQRWT